MKKLCLKICGFEVQIVFKLWANSCMYPLTSFMQLMATKGDLLNINLTENQVYGDLM